MKKALLWIILGFVAGAEVHRYVIKESNEIQDRTTSPVEKFHVIYQYDPALDSTRKWLEIPIDNRKGAVIITYKNRDEYIKAAMETYRKDK